MGAPSLALALGEGGGGLRVRPINQRRLRVQNNGTAARARSLFLSSSLSPSLDQSWARSRPPFQGPLNLGLRWAFLPSFLPEFIYRPVGGRRRRGGNGRFLSSDWRGDEMEVRREREGVRERERGEREREREASPVPAAATARIWPQCGGGGEDH